MKKFLFFSLLVLLAGCDKFTPPSSVFSLSESSCTIYRNGTAQLTLLSSYAWTVSTTHPSIKVSTTGTVGVVSVSLDLLPEPKTEGFVGDVIFTSSQGLKIELQVNYIPYIPIYTANDLKDVQKNLNERYILMNDIDLTSLEWTPIGTLKKPFTGILKGDDKEITGLSIQTDKDYAGLFGYIEDATIEGLILTGVSIEGANIVGGIAGMSKYAQIINCSVSGTIQGLAAVGGIAGNSHNDEFNENSSEINIMDCTNNSNVIGVSAVGGIAGEHSGNSLNSHNTGVITGRQTLGGIAGSIWMGSVDNCTNSGNIQTSGANIEEDRNIGGIAGYSTGSVSNSYNTGNINATANYVGGIVGENSGIVESCFNTGNILGGDRVGGIVGFNSYYVSNMVNNCFNYGFITGTRNIGGVVGYNNENSIISNCYNRRNVKGSYTVGGLVGNNKGHIEKSYNATGVESTEEGDLGSVIGYNDGTFSGCYWDAELPQVLNNSSRSIKFGIGSDNKYDASRTTPLTTSQMTGSGVLTGAMSGLDAAFVKPTGNGYPELSVFANSTDPVKKQRSEQSTKTDN